MTYDVAIIGAGIVGSSIARVLSMYKLNVCMIEKSNDVSTGTSKANSGIIHAGYDPEPGSLMALLNVQGSEMYTTWAEELHLDYKNIGSLVVGFSDDDMKHIEKLYKRGLENGVKKLQIINQEELRKLEPQINENAVGALLAETAAIISPYQATWAIAENAVQNGVKLFLNSQVHTITPPHSDNGQNEKSSNIASENWIIHTGKDDIQAKFVINAAGLYADEISNLAGARKFKIKPRIGEYFLLDNNCHDMAHHTLFQTPDAFGKGVLVTPTVDGNILVGPSADDNCTKDSEPTTRDGQNLIMEKAEKTIENIPTRNIINSFSGIRALAYEVTESSSDTLNNEATQNQGKSNNNATQNQDKSASELEIKISDFIIEEDKIAKRFINVAGICSPGLSAAPAIGKYVAQLLEKAGLKLEKNKDFIPIHKGIESFKHASIDRKKQLIEENNLYGRIICRCEMITEAEIVQAIHSPIGATDIDGVKRRTRAGMGRCQGGFCSPRVTEIISRECKTPMTSVTKKGSSSYILNSKTRV